MFQHETSDRTRCGAPACGPLCRRTSYVSRCRAGRGAIILGHAESAGKNTSLGTIAGLAIDAPSGGLIGAGGFSKTLTAYLIYLAATRINLENALIRIPVLAAAAVVDGAIYFFWQRSLGHAPSAPFVQTISYNLIGTTVIGTFILYMLDSVFNPTSSQRRQFASRRRGARRSKGLTKRR